MKKILNHIGMCILSGFATQIGYILAQELISKYYDDRGKRPIGFNIR